MYPGGCSRTRILDAGATPTCTPFVPKYPTCQYAASELACMVIKPDPDIGGVGVIISFVASAGLALLAAYLGEYLLFALHVDRWVRDSPEAWYTRVFGLIIRWRPQSHTREIWQASITKFIIALSDLELVTGIAVLCAGWIRRFDEQVYHFTLITDMAFLSSNTHLVMVSFLEDYFKDHPSARYWRIGGIAITFVLLFVANLYTGHRDWLKDNAWPAQCRFDDVDRNPRVIGGTAGEWMGIWMFLLIYGYGRALFELMPVIWVPLKKRLRSHHRSLHDTGRALITNNGTSPIYTRPLRTMAGSFLIIAPWFLRVIFSKAWSVMVISTCWYGYGIWGLWLDRRAGMAHMGGDEEDTWGFGQLVPLFLLALPLFSTMQGVFELREQARTREQVRRLLDLARKLEWKARYPRPRGEVLAHATCQEVRDRAVAIAAACGVGGEEGEEGGRVVGSTGASQERGGRRSGVGSGVNGDVEEGKSEQTLRG